MIARISTGWSRARPAWRRPKRSAASGRGFPRHANPLRKRAAARAFSAFPPRRHLLLLLLLHGLQPAKAANTATPSLRLRCGSDAEPRSSARGRLIPSRSIVTGRRREAAVRFLDQLCERDRCLVAALRGDRLIAD